MTSRPKPEIALYLMGAPIRRILPTPRSRRICEPRPDRVVAVAGLRFPRLHRPRPDVDTVQQLFVALGAGQQDQHAAAGLRAMRARAALPRSSRCLRARSLPSRSRSVVMARARAPAWAPPRYRPLSGRGADRRGLVAVGGQPKAPVLRFQLALAHTLDGALVGHAVVDQVGDGADLEIVLRAKASSAGPSASSPASSSTSAITAAGIRPAMRA
jgi:hypothetical protein